MRTLTINDEGLTSLRADFGLTQDKDLADRLGVDKGTVSRVLKGKSAPGPAFIAAMLIAFPVKFEDIFDVVESDAVATALPEQRAA